MKPFKKDKVENNFLILFQFLFFTKRAEQGWGEWWGNFEYCEEWLDSDRFHPSNFHNFSGRGQQTFLQRAR